MGMVEQRVREAGWEFVIIGSGRREAMIRMFGVVVLVGGGA